mmetsp:Transcript_26583/g.55860  ORF Transcript_26583/g.55860 Transcript_26583/m.55860 type:complete len:312 (-) Transcript_26583:1106-2041(-)
MDTSFLRVSLRSQETLFARTFFTTLPPAPLSTSISLVDFLESLDLPRSAESAKTRLRERARRLGSASAAVATPTVDMWPTKPSIDCLRARTLRGIVGWLLALSRRDVALSTPFFLRIAEASFETCACAATVSSSSSMSTASICAKAARSSSSASSSSSFASMSGSTKSAMFLPSMISGMMSFAHSGRFKSQCFCSGREYTPAPPCSSSRSRCSTRLSAPSMPSSSASGRSVDEVAGAPFFGLVLPIALARSTDSGIATERADETGGSATRIRPITCSTFEPCSFCSTRWAKRESQHAVLTSFSPSSASVDM